MADIALVRIDDRLIHGQVAANMLKVISCKKIIIIDDAVAKDMLQNQVLKAVCPTGYKLDIMTVEQATAAYKENQFGDVGPVVIIFKNTNGCCAAYDAGVKFEKLQIGGAREVKNGDGRKQVFPYQVFLNKEEADKLNALSNVGVAINVQQTVGADSSDWKAVYNKYFA